jgi:hypothetical protein
LIMALVSKVVCITCGGVFTLDHPVESTDLPRHEEDGGEFAPFPDAADVDDTPREPEFVPAAFVPQVIPKAPDTVDIPSSTTLNRPVRPIKPPQAPRPPVSHRPESVQSEYPQETEPTWYFGLPADENHPLYKRLIPVAALILLILLAALFMFLKGG